MSRRPMNADRARAIAMVAQMERAATCDADLAALKSYGPLKRLAAGLDERDALTAGYVEDLEPIDTIRPYLRTYAESPYIRLEHNRQENNR